MAETIKVKDGRELPRPSGEKTRLPNNDVVIYKGYGDELYMGQDWEFTGRIKYESNEGWSETGCYLEIVLVWEVDHWIIPFKRVTKTLVNWVPFGWFEFEKEYDTVTTIVECDHTSIP